MPRPWNNWYHCAGHTYGAWLRGDPRGWRARHHREHVEGDYKHPPPPGTYDHLHQTSQRLMKRPPVVLRADERTIVCSALGEKLLRLGVEVIELCVTATHFHLLARFQPIGNRDITMPGLCDANRLRDQRDPLPRHALGLAKRHASYTLRELAPERARRLWAIRSKITPIRDRSHQLHAVSYIRRHAAEGAALWSAIKSATFDRGTLPPCVTPNRHGAMKTSPACG